MDLNQPPVQSYFIKIHSGRCNCITFRKQKTFYIVSLILPNAEEELKPLEEELKLTLIYIPLNRIYGLSGSIISNLEKIRFYYG